MGKHGDRADRGRPGGIFFLKRIIPGIEQGICYASLVGLAALPVTEAIARLIFKTGIPSSFTFMVHLLLVAGLFSGMLTTKAGDHLSISAARYFSKEGVKERLLIGGNLLSAFVVTIIAWCGVSFIKIGLTGRLIGFIPDRAFALVIPLAYGVMALRFARSAPLKGRARLFAPLVILLGTVCSFPVIAKIIWEFDIPGGVYGVIDIFYDLAYYLKIPGVIFLLLAALGGTPLFIVMGGLALILIQASGGEIDVTANQVYTALTQDSIIAIPLFTVAGFFLSESKAGERLVLTFRTLFSWLPGGMIIVTVIICAFFTSFTGASGVTILALGGILYTILAEHVKYSEKFSIGLLTSVGSIGLLFPPSLPIILVGATTMTNIIHLFLGGIFPGLILVTAVIVFGIIISVKTKIPVEPFKLFKVLSSLKKSALEILLPLFLIGGYFSGIFSLVEIGAVAVVYIFIVEVFIHRDIKFREIPRIFRKAVPIIGGVLSILALSQALSYYIVDTQAPVILARWLLSAIQSKVVFLLLLNLCLLVVGCLMDIFSAILIILPLVAPLGTAYGINPVHLGIIFITNLEVGFLTPPVGLNLFLASYRFKKPFVEICRYVLPFMLIQFGVVLLVTYVPALSTWLTRFF
ncbi:MAG: TRAP transporter large permease subunit [Treponema sp.]|jgi:tripartite ATP-independent transporter DctM subunit|nr:TRAP transporter large permease subunit [Treponema sp.]